MELEVCVLEEHYELLMLLEKYKNTLPSVLLHVDFHSDMGLPGNCLESQFLEKGGYVYGGVYNEDLTSLLGNDVTISSFLLFSVLRYGLRNIVHLKPTGDGVNYEGIIGTVEGRGQIVRFVKEEEKEIYPDSKIFSFTTIHSLERFNESNYILDIDLDYFNCNMNPQYPRSIDLLISEKDIGVVRESYSREFSVKEKTLTILQSSRVKVEYNAEWPWVEFFIDLLFYNLMYKPSMVSITKSIASGYFNEKFYNKALGYIKFKLSRWNKKDLEHPYQATLILTEYVIDKEEYLYSVVYSKRLNVDDHIRKVYDTLREHSGITFKMLVELLSKNMGHFKLLEIVLLFKRYLIIF